MQEGMATNFISLEHVNFAKSDVHFFFPQYMIMLISLILVEKGKTRYVNFIFKISAR